MSDPDRLAEARLALRGGDKEAAFRAITAALQHPHSLEDARLSGAFQLYAEIARTFADPATAEKLRAAAADFANVGALYEAAQALFLQHQFGVAATLLHRAQRLQPGQPAIVAELVANLHALLRYAEAQALLASSGLCQGDPLLSYLLGFSALMSGDLGAARGVMPSLAALSGPSAAARDALAGMLARADALSGTIAPVGGGVPPITVSSDRVDLGDHALTAWHAVIQGTLLCHESPHGYGTPMRGRYAFVQDSPDLMRQGVARLKRLLERAERSPGRVVAAPDRASLILALAVGQALELPVVPWAPGQEQSGLLTAWNLSAITELPFLEALSEHHPEQILFSHASSWVDPFSFAPDVTTLLYQEITNPFVGGALSVDPETQQIQVAPPRAEDDVALAKEILEAPIRDPSVTTVAHLFSVLDPLLKLPPEQRVGLGRREGRRLLAHRGSPVQSNRFG